MDVEIEAMGSSRLVMQRERKREREEKRKMNGRGQKRDARCIDQNAGSAPGIGAVTNKSGSQSCWQAVCLPVYSVLEIDD
jgi:hypothetical protein